MLRKWMIEDANEIQLCDIEECVFISSFSEFAEKMILHKKWETKILKRWIRVSIWKDQNTTEWFV